MSYESALSILSEIEEKIDFLKENIDRIDDHDQKNLLMETIHYLASNMNDLFMCDT